MFNRLMVFELGAHRPIKAAFIAHQLGFLVNIIANDWGHICGGGVLGMEATDLATTFY